MPIFWRRCRGNHRHDRDYDGDDKEHEHHLFLISGSSGPPDWAKDRPEDRALATQPTKDETGWRGFYPSQMEWSVNSVLA